MPSRAGLPSLNPTNSFWLSEPSHLSSHRTTPNLPSNSDVVVIGSGISGAFATHWLRQLSPQSSITVLDAREVCSGATARNGGHCAPWVCGDDTLPHVAEFERRNLTFLRKLVLGRQIDCEWHDTRGVHAYFDADTFKRAVRSVENVQQQDPDIGETLSCVQDGNVLHDIGLSPSTVGAVIDEQAATLWPYKLIVRLFEDMLQDQQMLQTERPNLNLQFNTPVTRLQQLPDETWMVHTSRGMLATKQVLLATNAYTSYLVPEFTDLIVPVQGQMTSLIAPAQMKIFSGQRSYAFLGGGSDTCQKDEYLIQRSSRGNEAGRLLFGGGRRFAKQSGVGNSDDSEIHERTSEFLRNELNTVLDSGGDVLPLRPDFEWSGIMGFSRDGYPWVGEMPAQLGGGNGLYCCAGFTGHGMANATLSALAVVKVMLGKEQTEIDLPNEYRVSWERVQRAKLLPNVKSIDIGAEM